MMIRLEVLRVSFLFLWCFFNPFLWRDVEYRWIGTYGFLAQNYIALGFIILGVPRF